MLKLHDMIQTVRDLAYDDFFGEYATSKTLIPEGSLGEIVAIDLVDSKLPYQVYWHFDCPFVTLWVKPGWIQECSEVTDV